MTGWNYVRGKALAKKGPLCEVCGHRQFSAPLFVELRNLHATGRISEQDMAAATEGLCRGHFGEWRPDFVIQEEYQP